MAVNGDTITITVGGVSVASQRDVTIDDALAKIVTSTKDTRHESSIGGETSGTVTLDALYIYNDAAQLAVHAARRDATVVTLVWVDSVGTNYTATALCTGLTKNAPQKDVVTWNATFDKTSE